MNINSRTLIRTLAAAALAAAPAFASPDRDPDPRESYSYVRSLDGRATLASEGAGPGEEAELNQPLLVGDRVSVARGARVEIALADHNLIRLGGDTALTLRRVAFSGDSGDRTTRLDLDEGEILLVVTEEALGDNLPEVRTPGAEIVVHEPGLYRVETDRSGWTELVVRDGFAELVTAGGSSIVRSGETAITFGDRWSGVDLASAGSEDTLERWGAELDRRADAAANAVLYVEPELADDAAPLAEHGTWVSYDSAWYWRPRVAVDWRPYWLGRWAWTPSGLTWVSSEPWGWVPYHYGTWSQIPGYGWAWRPGRVYAPAWVYWHWSDAWVGWCPVGYYTGWYGPGYSRRGFHFGVYGWASGGWGSYSHWNFGPTYCLRGRNQRRHYRHGRDLERELGSRVPRGLVTTDTRGLPRRGFADEGVGSRELLRRIDRRLDKDPLVDVTDFVARRRQLPPDVVRAVQSREGDRIRLAEVPRSDVETARPGWDRRGDRAEVLRRERGAPGSVRPEGTAGKARPGIVDDRTGGRDDRSGASPRSGADRQRPTVVEPRSAEPRRTDSDDSVRRESADRVPPSDRQGWRGDAGPRVVSPRVPDQRTARPPVPRLQPGERAEIDPDGRVRRLPSSGDSGRSATPPRRSSGDTARPTGDSLQGWRRDQGSTAPRTTPPAATGSGAPSTRRSEPVQRVLGGLRRGDTTRPSTLPPSTTYRRPESGRTSRPPSGSTSTPRVTPRTTPPRSSPPTVTPPPSSRAPSSSTRPSSGGSRPSSSTRSSQKSGSRSDSPPPRRKGDKD